MLHTVVPIVDKVLLEELVILGGDAVLQTAGVAQLNLLIPPLITHRLLPFEGEDGGKGDVQVGQRHGNG